MGGKLQQTVLCWTELAPALKQLWTQRHRQRQEAVETHRRKVCSDRGQPEAYWSYHATGHLILQSGRVQAGCYPVLEPLGELTPTDPLLMEFRPQEW